MPAESRGPVERALQAGFKSLLDGLAEVFEEAGVRELHISSMKARILWHDDISLACGWCWVVNCSGFTHPSSLTVANDAGIFTSVLRLYHRVEPLQVAQAAPAA